MNERAWERLGATTGLASAVLLAAGILVVPAMRGGEVSTPAIGRYFVENAMRVRISALLISLAAVAFLWFVGHLRHVLQRAEGGSEAFSPVVFASGVALSTVAIVAALPGAVLGFLAQDSVGIAGGGMVRAMYGVHVVAGAAVELLVALFAASAGAAMVRRELAGQWLGWLGLLVALIGVVAGITTYLLANAAVFGVVMVYLTTASIVMLVRPEVERARTARTVFAH